MVVHMHAYIAFKLESHSVGLTARSSGIGYQLLCVMIAAPAFHALVKLSAIFNCL